MTNMKLKIALLLIIAVQSSIILVKQQQFGAEAKPITPIKPIECPTCPRCLFTMPVRATTTVIKRTTTTQINFEKLRKLINR